MASLPWRGGLGRPASWRHEGTEVPSLCDHRCEDEQSPCQDSTDDHVPHGVWMQGPHGVPPMTSSTRARAFSCSTISPCSSSSLSWSVSRLLRSVRKSTLPTAY